MDPSELSRLLYLTDALVAAPKKGAQLLQIVADPKASASFRKEIDHLMEVSNDPQTLRSATEALKKRLG